MMKRFLYKKRCFKRSLKNFIHRLSTKIFVFMNLFQLKSTNILVAKSFFNIRRVMILQKIGTDKVYISIKPNIWYVHANLSE